MTASRKSKVKSNPERADEVHRGNGVSPLKSPMLARLKGLVNGVNPKWGTRTVIVSALTGDVLKVEEGMKKGTK